MQILRTRLSIADLRKFGMVNTFKDTYAKDGFRGLYRGLGVTLVAGGPASGLFFLMYEKAKVIL